MSPFIILPLAVIAMVAIFSLDIWAGLKIADMTEDSGFSAGFYFMTVIGLVAFQVSAFFYLVL